MSRRVNRIWTVAIVAASGLAVGAALPVHAQVADDGVSIPDGEWHGVIAATSTYASGPGAGGATFQGEMTLTSNAGELDGSYTLSGTGEITGPDSHGTAEYEAAGVVGGLASAPLLQPTGGSIHMVLTVDGQTQEMTMPLGPEEGASTIVLTHGTCGQIVGRYVVTAEGMTGEGTVVLTRVGDLAPGTEGDYETQVVDLLLDVAAFKDAVIAGAAVSYADLGPLLERAESLQRSLRRNEACGLTSDGALTFVITEVIEELLQFALADPDRFSDANLFDLTDVAVRTGVIGPAALGEGADALTADVAAEWDGRLDDFIAAGDQIGIDMVAAVGELIGDSDLVDRADAAAATAETP